MIKRLRWTIRYIVAFWAVTATTNARPLRKVWEIDLKDSIKEIEHSKIRQPTVFALRFSPDGQHIAVVVEQYVREGGERESVHLLVVPLQRSDGAPIRQFEISAGVEDLDHLNRWVSFEWTAAGDAIVVGGDLVRFTDRKPCGLTLGDVENPFAEEGRIARFLLLDRECSQESNWKFARDWIVNDVSIGRALLCVSQPVRWGSQDLVAAETARISGLSNEVLVVEPFTGKVLQHWPPSVMPAGDVKFGDSGRVICEGKSAEARRKTSVGCWQVDTGKQIAEAAGISGGAPIALATRGTRAVASDYSHAGIPFTDSFREVLKRRIVWDFKTGRELASWKPELQPYDIGVEPVTKWWSAFSISADGQYVAEGGNGVLRLYKIEP